MSAGSGFHSITGDWQFDDYSKTGTWTNGKNTGKQKYKSRKIAIHDDKFDLMGFVKISLLSEEEKIRRAEQKKQQQEERAKAAADALAEQKQREQEEGIRKQEEEKKQEQFNRLISEAEKLRNEEQWEAALEKFTEAKELTNCSSYDYEIESLKFKVAQIEREKILAANAEKEAAERKKANQIPLSQKIATEIKLPTMFGKTKQWMKQNDMTELSEDDKQVLKSKIMEIYASMRPRDQKGLKNFGKDLDAIISPDLAKQWFDEIVNK